MEPLLPLVERRYRYPGRRRLDDRACLNGILFVLHTGIAWRDLPQELGYGSGVTCWRRLREWQQAGVWERLHRLLLDELNAAGEIDWSRAVADASHIRALFGGPQTGPSPVDRARSGSKHHLLTDANGVPLAVTLTGGNRHDSTQLLPLLDAVGGVRGRRGPPRRRPDQLIADRGYDYPSHRRALRRRGIRPVIARRLHAHGSGLGAQRWVIERSLAWLHQYRRLRIRWERSPDIHLAFLTLACALICYRRLSSL
ncbi:MAG TPA: IS5 family transposase [Solirubrobacteraceae bacterium]|nr:IS5 family transposase [Solirubrobacteraceae bacterium]